MAQQPLVNPLFPEWDWHDSNGQATAEETQQAEIALLNKGRVSRFIPIVWNDLVNKVYQLKTEIGDKWIEEYATYQNTLIPDGTYIITANAFNALVQNIKHGSLVGTQEYSDLIELAFGWADDEEFRGYLGREEVYGVSQMGAQADQVYGSYEIEIVNKLNYSIAQFKHYYKGLTENRFAIQNSSSGVVCTGTPNEVVAHFSGDENANPSAGDGKNTNAENAFEIYTITPANSGDGYASQQEKQFIINTPSPAANGIGENQIAESRFIANDISLANAADGGQNTNIETREMIISKSLGNQSDGQNTNIDTSSYGQQSAVGISGGVWHYQDGNTLYIKKAEYSEIVSDALRLW